MSEDDVKIKTEGPKVGEDLDEEEMKQEYDGSYVVNTLFINLSLSLLNLIPIPFAVSILIAAFSFPIVIIPLSLLSFVLITLSTFHLLFNLKTPKEMKVIPDPIDDRKFQE